MTSVDQEIQDMQTSDGWSPAVIGSVVVLLGAGCLCAIGSMPGRGSGSKAGARHACERFVKQRLKAPSSAAFSGAVSAKNPMGVRMRHRWSCKVRREDGGWRSIKVEVREG